jgi:hypothetical protein
MMENVYVLLKAFLSGLIIVFCAWLAGRKPVLAGFLIALPLMSVLSILFSYLQYRDIAKINQFATSILLAVPLSLFFFLPFILNKWLKMNFAWTFILALVCLFLAYFLHSLIFKSNLFR